MRDRLAYSIEEATEAANTGKTALYEALGSGKLPAHKRGRRTLILAADLRRLAREPAPARIEAYTESQRRFEPTLRGGGAAE